MLTATSTKRKIVKKSKEHRIFEALEQLNKAVNMEGPHIRIDIQWGIDMENDEGKKFMYEIKTFIKAYKEYYKMDKVDVELAL